MTVEKVCSVADPECSGPIITEFCKRHYYRLRNTGTTKPRVLINHWERFTVNGSTGCWEWSGPKNKKGYGKIPHKYGQTLAHRAFYIHSGKTIPDGLQLDHLCRNPPCVNPDHLEPVTRDENQDRGKHPLKNKKMCRYGHNLLLSGAIVEIGALKKRRCRKCWLKRSKEGGQRYRDNLKATKGTSRPFRGCLALSEECSVHHGAKGYCGLHYSRLRRLGFTENPWQRRRRLKAEG